MGELTPLFVTCRLRKLVEYMKVPLILDLANHTAFLEQVVCDLGSNGLSVAVKHDLEVFSLPIKAYQKPRAHYKPRSKNAHDDLSCYF